MAKTVDHTMRDSSNIAETDVSFLSTFKGIFKFDRKNSIGLSGQDKVQYIKMEYDARKDAFDEIKDILRSGRMSLVKDIDLQLELCRKEIEQIDRLINSTVDPQKREEYVRKRERDIDRNI